MSENDTFGNTGISARGEIIDSSNFSLTFNDETQNAQFVNHLLTKFWPAVQFGSELQLSHRVYATSEEVTTCILITGAIDPLSVSIRERDALSSSSYVDARTSESGTPPPSSGGSRRESKIRQIAVAHDDGFKQIMAALWCEDVKSSHKPMISTLSSISSDSEETVPSQDQHGHGQVRVTPWAGTQDLTVNGRSILAEASSPNASSSFAQSPSQAEIIAWNTAIVNAQSMIETLKIEKEVLELECVQLRNRSAIVVELEEQIRLLTAECEAYELKIEFSQAENEVLQQQLQGAMDAVLNLRPIVETAKNMIMRREAMEINLHEEEEFERQGREMEAVKEVNISMQQQMTSMHEAVATLEAENVQITDVLSECQQALEQSNQYNRSLKIDEALFQEEIVRAEHEIVSLRDSCISLEGQVRELVTAVEEQTDVSRGLQNEIDRAETELAAARATLESTRIQYVTIIRRLMDAHAASVEADLRCKAVVGSMQDVLNDALQLNFVGGGISAADAIAVRSMEFMASSPPKAGISNQFPDSERSLSESSRAQPQAMPLTNSRLWTPALNGAQFLIPTMTAPTSPIPAAPLLTATVPSSSTSTPPTAHIDSPAPRPTVYLAHATVSASAHFTTSPSAMKHIDEPVSVLSQYADPGSQLLERSIESDQLLQSPRGFSTGAESDQLLQSPRGFSTGAESDQLLQSPRGFSTGPESDQLLQSPRGFSTGPESDQLLQSPRGFSTGAESLAVGIADSSGTGICTESVVLYPDSGGPPSQAHEVRASSPRQTPAPHSLVSLNDFPASGAAQIPTSTTDVQSFVPAEIVSEYTDRLSSQPPAAVLGGEGYPSQTVEQVEQVVEEKSRSNISSNDSKMLSDKSRVSPARRAVAQTSGAGGGITGASTPKPTAKPVSSPSSSSRSTQLLHPSPQQSSTPSSHSLSYTQQRHTINSAGHAMFYSSVKSPLSQPLVLARSPGRPVPTRADDATSAAASALAPGMSPYRYPIQPKKSSPISPTAYPTQPTQHIHANPLLSPATHRKPPKTASPPKFYSPTKFSTDSAYESVRQSPGPHGGRTRLYSMKALVGEISPDKRMVVLADYTPSASDPTLWAETLRCFDMMTKHCLDRSGGAYVGLWGCTVAWLGTVDVTQKASGWIDTQRDWEGVMAGLKDMQPVVGKDMRQCLEETLRSYPEVTDICVLCHSTTYPFEPLSTDRTQHCTTNWQAFLRRHTGKKFHFVGIGKNPSNRKHLQCMATDGGGLFAVFDKTTK